MLRLRLAASLTFLLASGCDYAGGAGPADARGESDDGADGSSVDSAPAPPAREVADDSGAGAWSPPTGEGWQSRDAVPYPRFGHAAVFDSKNDRMVVFGGGANDVWTLPLSGADAGVWAQLVVRGLQPPVHSSGALFTDAAVYDPVGERMIVCLNPVPVTAGTLARTEFWALALSGAPAWEQFAVLDAPDGAELQSARAVYDPSAQRVLLFGGALTRAGLWSLSLEAAPVFTRLAGAPPVEGVFYDGHTLLLDSARNRVLLFGGFSRQQQLFALDLDDPHWQLLDAGSAASAGYGVAAALDLERDRIVLVGGDQAEGLATFSLTELTWNALPAMGAPQYWPNASVVVDGTRDRLIFFGGMIDGQASNATLALALDALAWQPLNDVDDRADGREGYRNAVYDPVRNAVVSFGDYQSPETFAYELDPGTTRDRPRYGAQRLAVGTPPKSSWAGGVYDSVGEDIVTFGGYNLSESLQLSRLGSEPGARWETLDAGAGPKERSGHVSVYDARGRRMIVFGGARSTSYPPREDLDDVWALSLGQTPSWTALRPDGPAPPAGQGSLGAYDPEGHRMLVYAGASTFALSLGEDPQWTTLAVAGSGPGLVADGSALYDPEGRRLVVVKLDAAGAHVFALPLVEPLIWHEYCPDTLTPAPYYDFPDSRTEAVLVPDGLFITLAKGAFRFSLETAYCDP